MNLKKYVDLENELDDYEIGRHHQVDTRRAYARMTTKMAEAASRFKQDQTDFGGNFKFTYEPARFEEWWLLTSLSDFYEQQWIGDVLQRVKSGKEACVYQCLAGAAMTGELAAAKVYRPWSLRNLRKDGRYRQGRADLDNEGRVIIDHGKLNAMRKKTEYGRGLLHQSWIAYEFQTLQTLHAAGADVPEPFAVALNAILMGFVGDRAACAPSLVEVSLGRSEARWLFDRVLRNIDTLLSQDRIHGDLSAYNILYWKGAITLIDFPQVVAPRENPEAYAIFQRDVRRICEYFGRQGVMADAARLSKQMWEAHGHSVQEVREQE